ncbi:MAG: hypothetical protein Q9183_004458 [Haloplaca sp. 2 TL-2023]
MASSKPSSEAIATASPSASILLVSPNNEILLLQRVKKSSSFASAHVFPGGHIDPDDGPLPSQDDVHIHEDNPAYRMGAIRECFEESGILLAKSREGSQHLLRLDEADRDSGRHAVHNKKVKFQDWVRSHGGEPDTGFLHPFTRWLTPSHIPRRFSTQMYLYFLPLAHPGIPQSLQIPTSDGGVEHTEAHFLPPAEWLSLAKADKIILFPPQFFLLSLVADFLKVPRADSAQAPRLEILQDQRNKLLDFIRTGDPSWEHKCISPSALRKEGKRLMMGLDEPGQELEGTGRRGDAERVIWVQFKGKEGTSGLEVAWRRDAQSDDIGDGGDASSNASEDEGLRQALRGPKENL